MVSESSAWLVDINDPAEPLTPQLALTAVNERMQALNTTDNETAQKQFRRLFNNWFNDIRKWSAEGKNSTIDSIKGYCKEQYLNSFSSVLLRLEMAGDPNYEQFRTEKLERETDAKLAELDAELALEAEEFAFEISEEAMKNKEVQLHRLEAAADAMEAALDDGNINNINTPIPFPIPNPNTATGRLDLSGLSKVMGKAGVTVDEDFIIGMKNIWRINDETRVNLRTSGVVPSFIGHFLDTDTSGDKKKSGTPTARTEWNLHEYEEVAEALEAGNNIKLENDEISKNIRDALVDLVSNEIIEEDKKYDALEKVDIKKNGEEFFRFKQMKFHLNLVALTLEKISDENTDTVDIWCNSFRRYTLQSFRDAIFLMKNLAISF